MRGEQLNAAFERFIDAGICRDAQQDLRSLIRTAFVAGWCAARCPDRPAAQTEPPR